MDIITSETKATLLAGYTYKEPTSFIVIDNFLKDEIANHANCSFLDFISDKADYGSYRFSLVEHNKVAFTNNLGNFFDAIFDYFHTDEFIDYIEALTGIKNIIRNDKTLIGAGIHRIINGGYLNVHTDFNMYESTQYGKVDRRINLLVYLNPEWNDEYNGHLFMCDKDTMTAKYKIAPLFNRCVIFNTTSRSLHGHPFPLKAPEGVHRHSIAIYYYTKNTNYPHDFEGSLASCVHYYDTDSIDFSGAKAL